MTVTAYLFDYTLNVLCGGNRSECARRLEIRRPDFNRMQQRIEEGGVSVRAIEAILLLFWREHLSLDQVLKGYLQKIYPDGGAADDPQEVSVRLLRDEMILEWKTASSRMNLFKAAETFMTQLERTFCSDDCRALRGCKDECPCKKFADLVDWLRTELDRTSPQKQK